MDINCKRAAELLSDSMHRKLTRYERLSLGLHKLICSACRRLRRQFSLIRAAMRDVNASQGVTMPDEVRERVAQALRRHANSS